MEGKLKKVLAWDFYKENAKEYLLVEDLGEDYAYRYVVIDKYKDSNTSKRFKKIEEIK